MRFRTSPVGAVLAGGGGRRIGGDKAIVELNGRPLISYPLEAVRQALGQVAILAKADTKLPYVSGVTVWIEPESRHHPLVGITQALALADGRPVVVCGADLPFVTSQLVRRLAKANLGRAPAAVACAEGAMQPLLGCYQHRALELLRRGGAGRGLPGARFGRGAPSRPARGRRPRGAVRRRLAGRSAPGRGDDGPPAAAPAVLGVEGVLPKGGDAPTRVLEAGRHGRGSPRNPSLDRALMSRREFLVLCASFDTLGRTSAPSDDLFGAGVRDGPPRRRKWVTTPHSTRRWRRECLRRRIWVIPTHSSSDSGRVSTNDPPPGSVAAIRT